MTTGRWTALLAVVMLISVYATDAYYRRIRVGELRQEIRGEFEREAIAAGAAEYRKSRVLGRSEFRWKTTPPPAPGKHWWE